MRDDSNDIAVISDGVWLGLSALDESTARISAALSFGLLTVTGDTAIASDEVSGRVLNMPVDSASMSESAGGRLLARALVSDSARVRDGVSGFLFVLHEDSATISDGASDGVSSGLFDDARISDESFSISTRFVHELSTERARVSDEVLRAVSTVFEESAAADDFVRGRLRARDVSESSAGISDEEVSARSVHAPAAVDAARLSGEVVDHLAAFDAVTDWFFVEDALPGLGTGVGRMWTANVDNFAMSRYETPDFSGIAVIDGVLYAMAGDGVHAARDGGESIEARIVTGKIDFSGKSLVHPLSAIVEYELDDSGEMQMEVTQTQSGVPETFAYPLRDGPAGALTNGRFTFGRGLRGRHFSFALHVKGERARVEDVEIVATPTKRRV